VRRQQKKIDDEVKSIIDQTYQKTKDLLVSKKDKLEEVARLLLEKEVVEEADLKSPVFPVSVPEDFGSFRALIGLGECFLKKGDSIESARMFRRAAKLKANSHRPFLGFGKLFLEMNDLGKAEEALEAYNQSVNLEPGNAVAWSNKGYLLALLGLAIYFLGRAIFRYWRGNGEKGYEEINESLWSWSGFKDDLNSFLRGLTDRFRRSGARSGPPLEQKR
jgi:tetratricopeptide (TPR) repeat protein